MPYKTNVLCFCHSKFPWNYSPLTSGETLRRNLYTECQEVSTLHSLCCPSCSAALGASATLLLGLGCYKPGSCPWALKHTGQFVLPGSQRLLNRCMGGWQTQITWTVRRHTRKSCGTTGAGAACSSISISMQMVELTAALYQEKRVEQSGYIIRVGLSHFINMFLRNWKETRKIIWINMLRTEEEGAFSSFAPWTSLFCSHNKGKERLSCCTIPHFSWW